MAPGKARASAGDEVGKTGTNRRILIARAVARAPAPIVQQPDTHAVETSDPRDIRAWRKALRRNLRFQFRRPAPTTFGARDHFNAPTPVSFHPHALRTVLMTMLNTMRNAFRTVLMIITIAHPPRPSSQILWEHQAFPLPAKGGALAPVTLLLRVLAALRRAAMRPRAYLIGSSSMVSGS